MVLEYYFEVTAHMKPADVVELLSNPTTLLPLWSIYEEITEIKGLDEFTAKLNIAGSSFLVKFKLTKSTREQSSTITLIGTGTISMRMVLRVEPKDTGSLVRCRINIRAGFFRERSISSFMKSFVDDFRNKLIFQLPMLIDALGVGRGGLDKVVEVKEEGVPSRTIPHLESKTGKVEESRYKEEEKIPDLTFSEDPDLLRDDVFLSSVILRSTLTKFRQVDVKGDEVLKVLKEMIPPNAAQSGSTFYISINCTSLRVKMYVEGLKIKGLRIEFSNGHILSGAEALKYLRSLRSLGCRAYLFVVSA